MKKHNFNLLLNSCPDAWGGVFTVLRCSNGGSRDLLSDSPVSALVLRLWPGFWLCLMTHWTLHNRRRSTQNSSHSAQTSVTGTLKDADISSVFSFSLLREVRGEITNLFPHVKKRFPRSLTCFFKKKVSQNTFPEYWFITGTLDL